MAGNLGKTLAPLPEPHQKCAECPIRQRALFRGVSEHKLEWTQRYRGYQAELPAKQHIFLEGEPAPNAYTLFEGWVALYKTLPNGKRQIMRFAMPGDFLGFQSSLEGPMVYGAITITRTLLCAFPRQNVQQMLQKEPSIALEMAALSASYMELCQYHLMGAGRKSAKERIAFLLLELYHRAVLQIGDPDNDGVHFPICQEEIADAVGLTTVHVNRMLQELKAEGLVNCSSRRLKILDEPRLAEIANFDGKIVRERMLI